MKSYSDTITKLAQDQEARGETVLSESLRATDDASKAVQKTENRVSLDSILERIKHVDYMCPHRHEHLTLAIITLVNGFVIIGKSAPADPANYDKALGEKFAYEDAVRQIWPLEAYLLREKLHSDI